VAFFHAEADSLDNIGRVIDFSVLKEKMGGWIDKYWDHNFIIFKEDHDTIYALDHCVQPKETFKLPINPTAENMADYLLHEIAPKEMIGTGVRITKVVLWETENCYAEVSLEN